MIICIDIMQIVSCHHGNMQVLMHLVEHLIKLALG